MASLIGKAPIQLIRLCVFLRTLNLPIEIVQNKPWAKEVRINSNIESIIKHEITLLKTESFIIQKEQIEDGIALLDYFHLHKISMAAYVFDPSSSFDEILSSMLKKFNEMHKISERFNHLYKLFMSRISKILFLNRLLSSLLT